MQTTYGLLSPFHYGRGYQDLVFPANPAAGGGFTYVISGQYWSRLISCAFQLTTSSTVQNRFVTLAYETQAGGVFGGDGPAAAVAASATSQQFYGAAHTGTSSTTTGSAIFFPLSGTFLAPGSRIVFGIANVDTTDQLAAIGLLFERFEVGEEGYLVGGIDTQQYATWAAEHFG